jgi:hypothetical protein
VHETAQQIDTSKKDGHDGDEFRDGAIHGVIMAARILVMRTGKYSAGRRRCQCVVGIS